MEKRLELKDIAGYLPYGLNVQSQGSYDSFGFTTTQKAIGVFHGEIILDPKRINLQCCWVTHERALLRDDVTKPFLRPMSDLFKEIEANGETITVIAKVAEIYGYISHGEVEGNAWGWDIPISDDYQDCYFGWDDDWFHYFNNDGEGGLDSTGCKLPFHIEIMDMLHRYHFDYRGLIDKGLAIDINALPRRIVTKTNFPKQ